MKMNKLRSTVLRLSLLLLWCSFGINAQQMRLPRPGGPWDAPFDLTIDKLPASYSGIDASTLIEVLQMRTQTPEKDEFETTAQWRQRTEAVRSLPLPGKLRDGDTMAFVVSPKAFSSKYDADAGILNVEIELDMRFLLKDGVGVPLFRFGTNKNHILISNPSDLAPLKEGAFQYSLQAQLPLDIPTARSLKGNMGFLAIGHLDQSLDSTKAVMRLDQFWIFDKSTGMIAMKHAASPGLANQSNPPQSTPSTPSASVAVTTKADDMIPSLSISKTNPNELIADPDQPLSGLTFREFVDYDDETPTRQRSGPTSGVVIRSKPRAQYTDSARQQRIEGKVTLKVTFQADGRIGAISPVSGLGGGLTEKAIAAAKGIVFEPAMKNGIPYTVTAMIEYTFTIY